MSRNLRMKMCLTICNFSPPSPDYDQVFFGIFFITKRKMANLNETLRSAHTMRLVAGTSRRDQLLQNLVAVASSHGATSPCDWSLRLVAGTSRIVCTDLYTISYPAKRDHFDLAKYTPKKPLWRRLQGYTPKGIHPKNRCGGDYKVILCEITSISQSITL